MTSFAELPDEIPLFPLPGALLMPRARLPLHIFEPRYLAMIDDVLKTQSRLVGMIQPMPDNAKSKGLHTIGCAGRLTGFSETEDRRYMITLAGISRFRLVSEIEGFSPYRKARVSWTGFESDRGSAEKDPDMDREAFFGILARYFDHRDLKTDWESLKDADDELLINSLSMLCPFEPEDKQALLETPSLSTRRETLMALMEFSLRSGQSDEVMQ